MFEDAYYSFEAILQRMLSRVADDVDKRAGSIIYDALAPCAAELAQTYIQLDAVLEVSFADTASDDYLSRRTSEFGVQRATATAAVRKGLFYGANEAPLDVPMGSWFGIEDLTYVVQERISLGVYNLLCDTVGIVGNQQFGTLLPIDYVPGLVRAELADVIVPGEDQETDDALRLRYYETVNEPAFGGNIADYEQTVNAMDGVGATKVFPVWNGGGTVKCTIIAADWSAPSSTLVSAVQTAVDPTANQGKGYGTAPIGHVVTVAGVSGVAVDVTTTVILAEGSTAGQVQAPIESAVTAYLLGLRQTWATTEQIIVRVALIEAAILAVPGVIDVSDTMLGGIAANMTLAAEEIPLMGTVTVHAS
ncbi:baseplate J/gp47 family protein [Paenibacillus sanguinis]|uniref:baseplate J/gp47 family protein n=1 Tax=Paenibacillus sanguinis TaxID=225906 RepID=UPI0003677C5B|nr:baseplate J/gp47 family protein [Paenibacillus sanguinis]